MRSVWILALVLIAARLAPLAAGSKPRIGDLALASLPCAICPLIELTTKSPYSHIGIVDEDSDGALYVIEAIGPKVRRVTIEAFVKSARGKVKYYRMSSPENLRVAQRAAEAARGFLGRPYDPAFVLGPERLYCSEMVYFAFLAANEGRPVFKVKPMTFAPYSPLWSGYLGSPPPEGELGINPGDIARSSLLIAL